MRVALVQLDPLVAELEGNAARMTEAAVRACEAGADLVVFPELCLVGYPPLDLLDEPGFVDAVQDANRRLVDQLGQRVPAAAVAFGTVDRRAGNGAKDLRNVAILARGGRFLATRAKTLLPSYDVFDEDRWFAPAESNRPVDLDGHRLGLTICEDIWNDELYWSKRLYDRDPVAELCEAGVDAILNISASPFHRGKAAARERMLSAVAARHGVPILFANQVGGNDELIFDGGTVAFDGEGRPVARAARFREDAVHVELARGGALLPSRNERVSESDPPSGSVREVRQALVLGIRDYVSKCGFERVVLGLSGGIDSAVVAALAVDALGPARVEGVLMPSRYSSQGSVADARELGRRLGIATRLVPIEQAHAALLSMLGPHFEGRDPDTTEENLQARIRGAILMALSNKFGWLVLSTGNKSELAVGYCTLYGDMNGGLAVLGDCFKGAVRELAQDLNDDGREAIPRAILDKPPSAELRPDQRDEDSLPPYAELDAILEGLIERRLDAEGLVDAGADPETTRRIQDLLDANEYKRRQAPPVLRVTSKAFGPGRRIPLARAQRRR